MLLSSLNPDKEKGVANEKAQLCVWAFIYVFERV